LSRLPLAVLARSRPQRIAAVVVAVGLGGIGFLPLFGGPGYEQSLASGLIVPSAAAIATALEVAAVEGPEPLAAVGRGVASGLGLAAIALATALLHGLRVGICDLTGGVVGFAMTAGFGAVLGGAWGACVAEVARRRKHRRLWCVLGALAAPLGCVAVSVGRFYTSPMIFAYDPFVGFFSGTLYDTIIDTGTSLITYRAGSLATLVSLALLASVLARDEGSRLRLQPRSPGVRARLALGIAALLVSLGITASGPALGHWETSSTIAADLGGFRAGPRCDIVYPSTTSEDQIRLLLKDCHEELASVEAALGTRLAGHVTAFFFRDAGDKKRLMGAADTYIAKPWRREVYLQMGQYPHPVLGHELAHVVAGSFARGPFVVGGRMGGYWPNPGLIEGVAVAASPDDDELTTAQWAHAMLELKMLPPMSSVFSFDFLGSSASKSYTLAGAFVRWAMTRYGVPAVQAWYAGTPIETLTHRTWAELDEAFRADMARTPLPPEALAYARARFERPAIFGRRCPHVVDALRRKADGCRESLQVERAVALYDEVLSKDPHDDAAMYGRGLAQIRYGDRTTGKRELSAFVVAQATPRTWRDRATDALADAELLAGNHDAAASAYGGLAASSVDEDFGRTEEVKALASVDAMGRPAIEALLIGTEHKPADIVVASARLGEWEQAAGSPIPLYLLGKNLAGRGWYPEAAAYLERALAAGPAPTPRIGRETLRQRAICACALDDASAVAKVRAAVEGDGVFGSSLGRRDWVLRLLARCTSP
jgi:tetratricopeptide (TPR) repeat protein